MRVFDMSDADIW